MTNSTITSYTKYKNSVTQNVWTSSRNLSVYMRQDPSQKGTNLLSPKDISPDTDFSFLSNLRVRVIDKGLYVYFDSVRRRGQLLIYFSIISGILKPGEGRS